MADQAIYRSLFRAVRPQLLRLLVPPHPGIRVAQNDRRLVARSDQFQQEKSFQRVSLPKNEQSLNHVTRSVTYCL